MEEERSAMGVMISTGTDVVAFLKDQHEQIKSLFAQILEEKGDARTEQFSVLRRLLAVHETAEEEIVHPVARRVLPDGDEIVQRRLDEENDAKSILAELENIEVASPEFDRRFRELRDMVVTHAESEEQEEFERLAAHLDGSQLERMRTAMKLAEDVAPTRPHAGVESATANILAGPFASMMDRARDALSGKR